VSGLGLSDRIPPRLQPLARATAWPVNEWHLPWNGAPDEEYIGHAVGPAEAVATDKPPILIVGAPETFIADREAAEYLVRMFRSFGAAIADREAAAHQAAAHQAAEEIAHNQATDAVLLDDCRPGGEEAGS